MRTVSEIQLLRFTFRILMRNVVILFLLSCNIRQGFSARITWFKAEPSASVSGTIRLSQKQKLSLECSIKSSGQPYVARITNEEGVVLASKRDTNDSILTYTIHQVACHDIGSLTCELDDQTTSKLITSTHYLMVENCLPRTCKGSAPNLKMVASLHSKLSLPFCIIADTHRFIEVKFYINGQQVKLTDSHAKYRFDFERNEPSTIHFTIHLILLNVMTADYKTYNLTGTAGKGYDIHLTVQLDGVGKPCPEGWCETEQRKCLYLMQTGNDNKKFKWRCEHGGGTLFNGTISQATQYSDSLLANTNRKDHIVVYEDNQTCNVYNWANYTGKDIADFTSTSEFHIACHLPYWSEVGTIIQEPIDPMVSTESSSDNKINVYVSIGATLGIVLFGSFCGVLCYRKRGHFKKSKNLKSRLLESSSTTDAACFQKVDRESIYHTLEEADVATNRDTDNRHDYDLALNEQGLEDFMSPHIQRESIKPLPPPRPPEKSKLGNKCLDVSVYDVCVEQCTGQPVMNIADSTSHNILSIKELDNSLIENDFDLLCVDKGNTILFEKTLRNQNDNTESSEINTNPFTLIDLKNDTADYSTPLATKEEHQYSGYVKESKSKDEESLQTLKATDAYTIMIRKEDTCQDLDDKTVGNSIKQLKENNMSQASGMDSDSSKNENRKTLTLDSEDTEAYQGGYSLPLKRSDDHFYAVFARDESNGISSIKEKDHNAYHVQEEEHTKDLTDKQYVACNCKNGKYAVEKSRVSYVDLTDQAKNSDHENYTSPLSNFVHEKDCFMKGNSSNKSKEGDVLKCNPNVLGGKLISSNGTKVEFKEYTTLFDSETYPVMFNGNDIATEPGGVNDENWYLQFDGAQCEYGSQMRPGCESNKEYMTWDGGDGSTTVDVPSNKKPVFAFSSGEVALHVNSKESETLTNQGSENIKVGNSELQEDFLVYWTPDGSKKTVLEPANPTLADEYCEPYEI
ncbi:unnamed protein product [Lymnaea stagnalis]|uniref:Ig-like domain-containing protein n=1 Tax=Lymnaea stagnalis TaxID=6523 RepID=A0AAV2I8Q6_LYMST